jgi:hypothetical protein
MISWKVSANHSTRLVQDRIYVLPEIVRLIAEMQLAEKRGWVAAELR